LRPTRSTSDGLEGAPLFGGHIDLDLGVDVCDRDDRRHVGVTVGKLSEFPCDITRGPMRPHRFRCQYAVAISQPVNGARAQSRTRSEQGYVVENAHADWNDRSSRTAMIVPRQFRDRSWNGRPGVPIGVPRASRRCPVPVRSDSSYRCAGMALIIFGCPGSCPGWYFYPQRAG
jgi:hypothetical protein